MRILILSNGNGNYSTKRLVEVAEKRGHKVKVVKYKNAYPLIDRENIIMYKGKNLGDYDAIIPRIANSMTRYGTAILRQLEKSGTIPLESHWASQIEVQKNLVNAEEIH